jgi:hypothetical protein
MEDIISVIILITVLFALLHRMYSLLPTGGHFMKKDQRKLTFIE